VGHGQIKELGMNLSLLTHIHLLLNHFPTVGFSVGVGLFAVALYLKSDQMKRAGLGILLLIALISIPVYLTGKAAQRAIADQPDVSPVLMETHEDAAFLALIFMEITGMMAWLGLWQFRRMSRATNGNLIAVLFLSLITFVLMARAANVGGEIRHPEITVQGADPVNTEWIRVASIAGFINTTNWAWPTLETLHFMGLSMILGVALVVNLRMLGVAKNISFAALHRYLPWGILGFGLNVSTGLLFFVTIPDQYTENLALHIKMILMMIAGVNILYFTIFEEPWKLGPGDNASLRAKVVTTVTVVLWTGVIYFGRMMPFIGNSF
jgi:uncharacterized membrane protein